MRILVDIDSYVDYAVHSDLHLHAVAAYGFDILIPSMQGESTICKLGGHFILSI